MDDNKTTSNNDAVFDDYDDAVAHEQACKLASPPNVANTTAFPSPGNNDNSITLCGGIDDADINGEHGGLSIIEESKEGDSDKGIPRAPTKASTTSQTFPSPPPSNENNISKAYGEIDDVGTSSDGKVQNIQENHDHKKDVHKEELCLLKKRGTANAYPGQ